MDHMASQVTHHSDHMTEDLDLHLQVLDKTTCQTMEILVLVLTLGTHKGHTNNNSHKEVDSGLEHLQVASWDISWATTEIITAAIHMPHHTTSHTQPTTDQGGAVGLVVEEQDMVLEEVVGVVVEEDWEVEVPALVVEPVLPQVLEEQGGDKYVL